MALKPDGSDGGRSLEEILAVLLSPARAGSTQQTASAAGAAGVAVAAELHTLTTTAGPNAAEVAGDLAAIEADAAARRQALAESPRKRGKATRVMILMVAWTVSLRNHRRSRSSRRSGRTGPEKARPEGRPA
jgi:hypothetical protein